MSTSDDNKHVNHTFAGGEGVAAGNSWSDGTATITVTARTNGIIYANFNSPNTGTVRHLHLQSDKPGFEATHGTKTLVYVAPGNEYQNLNPNAVNCFGSQSRTDGQLPVSPELSPAQIQELKIQEIKDFVKEHQALGDALRTSNIDITLLNGTPATLADVEGTKSSARACPVNTNKTPSR